MKIGKKRALELYDKFVMSPDGRDSFDAIYQNSGWDEYEKAENLWQYFLDYLYAEGLDEDQMNAVADHESDIFEAMVGSLS